MDFNGDGRNDVISGSYSPGYLFVFAQREDGVYAAGEKIKDNDGKSIRVGYAAHVYAADWDSDNDLDLVVGNISGEVYFIRNEGKPGENAFGDAQRLAAGENPITAGRGDAGPVLADWDGDGLLDLIVGAGDGSVTFHRNKGTKFKPALDEGRLLIAVSQRERLGSGCGTRTKVCVTDYNGDGHVDLLVGDFASVHEEPPDLTPEQEAEAKKAQEEYQVAVREYAEAYQKSEMSKISREYRELQEAPVGETPEEAKAREERVGELMEQMQTLQAKELKTFIDRMTEIRNRLPQSRSTYHGFVWLYLRQPAETPVAGG